MVCRILTATVVLVGLIGVVVSSRLGDQWGTNIHWTAETVQGEAAMLSRAFKVARMDFSWGSIESKCGLYNFSAYDTLLAQMKAVGVRPYWIVDYGNRCYPSTDGQGCSSDACVAAYGRFTAAAAQHFQHQKDIIFEIVNEPNGMGNDNSTTIARLSAAAWPGFRAVGATWVGPTTSGFDWPYITTAFQAGLLETVSAVSVHPYRPTMPETALADFATLRGLIDQYSRATTYIPILDGEWGYTSATSACTYGNRVDEITQGKYVARMWLVSTLAGAQICISYDWRDDGRDPTQCEQNFGSTYDVPTGNSSLPFQPKPGYHAAFTMQRGVGEAVALSGRIQPSHVESLVVAADNIFIIEFSGNNSQQETLRLKTTVKSNKMFALWHNSTNTTSNATITFNATAAAAHDCWVHVDTFGAIIARSLCADGNGGIAAEVSNGPSYLLSSW
jgi:polysaccharide biosynthesis protein PslG